jgi:hypothetical protein
LECVCIFVLNNLFYEPYCAHIQFPQVYNCCFLLVIHFECIDLLCLFVYSWFEVCLSYKTIATPACFWDLFMSNTTVLSFHFNALCLCQQSVFLVGSNQLDLFKNKIHQPVSSNWIIEIINSQVIIEKYIIIPSILLFL